MSIVKAWLLSPSTARCWKFGILSLGKCSTIFTSMGLYCHSRHTIISKHAFPRLLALWHPHPENAFFSVDFPLEYLVDGTLCR